MNSELILEKLKQTYGLRDKLLLLVKVLSDEKPRSADELAKIADIPQGRVYEYLNELVRLGLVKKRGRKPYEYSIPQFNRAVVDFMRSKRSTFVKTENEVLELMKGDHEHIELIKTREDYTRAHLDLIDQSTHVRLSCFHRSFPFVLYPSDFELFVKLRKRVTEYRQTISYIDRDAMYMIFRSYQDALARGCKFEVIVEKWTVLDHLELIKNSFDASTSKKILAHVKAASKVANVQLIEEYLPMEIDIGDSMVVLALSHLDMATGIVSRSDAVHALYNTLFDQKSARTKNILEYL